jgi:uncharacterized protein (TIGR02145 family)
MLLDIVKQIIAQNGEHILLDPPKVTAFLLELAKNEPEIEQRVFIECLEPEHGVVEILKGVAKEELAKCKENLAQRLSKVKLYLDAIDILCVALKTNIDELSSFKDPRDGKVYRTVKIGNHWWMAENLRFSIRSSYCYNNDEAICGKFGRFYNWKAAKEACPLGWHLPTHDEWYNLIASAGGERVAGKNLKAKTGWCDHGNGTDDYGFSALPGGYRNTDGYFLDVGHNGYWWTATKCGYGIAYGRNISADNDKVNDGVGYNVNNGFSVRCVAD